MTRTKQTARAKKRAALQEESSQAASSCEPDTQSQSSSPGSLPDPCKPKTKKPKVQNNHPPLRQMVFNAVMTLKEDRGSTVQNIKKFMASHYKVDVEKLAPFIKKALNTAVDKGQLVKRTESFFKLSEQSHQ